jgi:hypothetical protein
MAGAALTAVRNAAHARALTARCAVPGPAESRGAGLGDQVGPGQGEPADLLAGFEVDIAHQARDVGDRGVIGVGEGEQGERAVQPRVRPGGEREHLHGDPRPGRGAGQAGELGAGDLGAAGLAVQRGLVQDQVDLRRVVPPGQGFLPGQPGRDAAGGVFRAGAGAGGGDHRPRQRHAPDHTCRGDPDNRADGGSTSGRAACHSAARHPPRRGSPSPDPARRAQRIMYRSHLGRIALMGTTGTVLCGSR